MTSGHEVLLGRFDDIEVIERRFDPAAEGQVAYPHFLQTAYDVHAVATRAGVVPARGLATIADQLIAQQARYLISRAVDGDGAEPVAVARVTNNRHGIRRPKIGRERSVPVLRIEALEAETSQLVPVQKQVNLRPRELQAMRGAAAIVYVLAAGSADRQALVIVDGRSGANFGSGQGEPRERDFLAELAFNEVTDMPAWGTEGAVMAGVAQYIERSAQQAYGFSHTGS